jgi:hypothetical protein
MERPKEKDQLKDESEMAVNTIKYGWIFVLTGIVLLVTPEKIYAQQKNFNWGVRVGLNALTTMQYETYYRDELLPGGSYSNRNGYLINTFVRFNIKRLFLQPELEWNLYRQGLTFVLPDDAGNYSQNVVLNARSKALNGNFLTGYHIIDNGSSVFSAYIGTSFAGVYRRKYKTGLDHEYSDKRFHLKHLGIIGFSISVSKVYFDLRYVINQPDTNLKFSDIPDFPDIYKTIELRKNENVLSFSFGLMF